MTPNKYLNIVSNLSREMVERKNEFEIPALQTLSGAIVIRVNNREQSTSGKVRAYRSEAYKVKYKKTGNVNMIKDGDLQKDFQLYRDTKGNNVIGFSDDFSISKIRDEEARRGDTLYFPNESEQKLLIDTASRFIKKIETKWLNKK